VDSAVEHATVASAGLSSRAFVSLNGNDAERAIPASICQFPGNGATDDPRTDDADVICIHRPGVSLSVPEQRP